MSERLLSQSLGWMDEGTAFFVAQVSVLSDDRLSEASRLPGWTRLHILSHMARNARALTNLLRWAETGVETPMYPSQDFRRDDIEAGARQPAAEVRADALTAAASFRSSVSAMPEHAWSAEVRTALGRPVPAAEVPWMRVREVWVHAVDLGAGATFADIDEAVAAALLDEAVARLADRDDCAAATLVSSGDGGRWVIGRADPDAPEISGTTQALAGWVLGRTGGAGLRSGATLPQLPAWL